MFSEFVTVTRLGLPPEYISSTIIAVIILYAGVTSMVESVKKILRPQAPDYSTWGLVIVGAAILVKVVLSVYVKKTGQAVRSEALIASGEDARNDVLPAT